MEQMKRELQNWCDQVQHHSKECLFTKETGLKDNVHLE